MNKIKKPMLAQHLTKPFSSLTYPQLATPKLDGIRCLIKDNQAVSRTFKLIPNLYIRQCLQGLPDGLDGELIVGSIFQETTSAVMSIRGEPDFTYHIFDYFASTPEPNSEGYYDRITKANATVYHPQCKILIPVWVNHASMLEEYEKQQLELGFEGIMIRTSNSPYKFGRSTEKEGYLLKIKRFEDAEARILGFEEQMENCNELTMDKLGHAERSTHAGGKKGKNTLGAFCVRGLGLHWRGKEFKIGTGLGLTKELRQEIWNNRGEYMGKIIKYKYQKAGSKDKPRTPVFLGFRDLEDI